MLSYICYTVSWWYFGNCSADLGICAGVWLDGRINQCQQLCLCGFVYVSCVQIHIH